MKTVYELRAQIGDTQELFSKRTNIPLSTIQAWESGIEKAPDCVLLMLEEKIKRDMINRKTITIPKHDPNKIELPDPAVYEAPFYWLQAIQEFVGQPIVFALDEALMGGGHYLGHIHEFAVWVYGDDSLQQYDGIAILGNTIDDCDVVERKGVRYTNFNRTLNDSLANENVLDMQGITEGLSEYYYTHNEGFEGVFVAPEYQERFKELAQDAIDYYTY